MGEQIGAATADLVADSLTHYLSQFRDLAGLDEATVRRAGSRFGEICRGFDAVAEQLLRGLAGGAGVAPELIFALNARTELLYGGRESERPEEGCTSLAVHGSHTTDGQLLVAQNWDWHPRQQGTSFLLATRDERGHAALTLTEPGMLAKSGISSTGLAVCANLLVSDRDRGTDGVPYHLLLRSVLHAPRISRALQGLLQARRISSGNLMLGAADEHGAEALNLELAPGYHAVQGPGADGLVVHANHFEPPTPFTDLRVDRAALTLLRPTRVRHRLAEALAARAVDAAAVAAALQDHFSFPDSVCRHVDPDVPEPEQTITCYALLLEPEAGRLSIATGPACENPFARWELASVFDEDAAPEVRS
ncbi:hypothetical protein CGZ93_01765 [Enemella dayhoffiae]|uniref:Peptidase C45 hydrolase domain-containing protein n=2 Tax=Enemella dayhoffiae TaxID=2016507 RepID=A0A255HC88_9ACTN|nr:hypothetical protein CGZ93_01765 [Enemella dayhoffiae]